MENKLNILVYSKISDCYYEISKEDGDTLELLQRSSRDQNIAIPEESTFSAVKLILNQDTNEYHHSKVKSIIRASEINFCYKKIFYSQEEQKNSSK